jgi:hypothetical protein
MENKKYYYHTHIENKIENAHTHIFAYNRKIKKRRRKNQTDLEALFLLPSFTLPSMVDPLSL